MNSEKMLVQINAADYGLEETKAREIQALFQPMLDRMVGFEKECNDIMKLEMSKGTCAKAKELRLRLVKVRTGTDKIHKKLKKYYLNVGRFIDGWKNAQLMASESIESQLKNIENYYEILELKRTQELQLIRAEKLEKYHCEIIPQNLGSMEELIWNNYLAGVKINYKTQLEAEKKAKKDRIKKEKILKLHNERKEILIPYWRFLSDEMKIFNFAKLMDWDSFLSDIKNKKTKYDAEQLRIKNQNEQLQMEAEKRQKTEDIRIKKEEEAQKIREEKERKEREAHDLELKKERKENERLMKLEDERLAKERAEKEAKRQEELAPDKNKLKKLSNDIISFPLPEMQDPRPQEIVKTVRVMLNKIQIYITEECADL